MVFQCKYEYKTYTAMSVLSKDDKKCKFSANVFMGTSLTNITEILRLQSMEKLE